MGGFIDVHQRSEYYPWIIEGIFFGARPRHPALMQLAAEALSRIERRYGDDELYTYKDIGINRMAIAGPVLLTNLRDMKPPVSYYRLEDTPDCKQFMFDPLSPDLAGNNSGYVTTHCVSNIETTGYWGNQSTKMYLPIEASQKFNNCRVQCPDWMTPGEWGCTSHL